MSDLFNINLQKARKLIIQTLLHEINLEFAAILAALDSRLSSSKTITKLPTTWINDVKKFLRFTVQDDEITDMIMSAIGVFDIDKNDSDKEPPKDVLWKAMIINYGSGHLLSKENEFLSEYESGGDFNPIRLNTSPKHTIVTRHDSYYDPQADTYIGADTENLKPNRAYPQFAHAGSFWWSDIYSKLLDETPILKFVDDIIDRCINKIDFEWLDINGLIEL